MQNVFAINKPKGPTSNAVLNQIRKKLGTKKVGHAGTLDPLASGVLVVGVDEGTRQLTQLILTEKEYVADVRLGTTSTTDDDEGEKTTNEVLKKPTRDDIEKIVPQFLGNIKQAPPLYSAVKIGGKAAYKHAREGKNPNLGFRDVEIKNIDILEYEWPHLKLRVVTGSGVYIRSLARDIGEVLSVGGHLADLVRTRVGEFTIDQAIAVENI